MLEKIKAEKGIIAKFSVLYLLMSMGTAYFLGAVPEIYQLLRSSDRTKKVYILCVFFAIAALMYIFRKQIAQVLRKKETHTFWSDFQKKFHINRKELYLLGFLIGIGCILRLIGINWGVTSVFQPDEGKLVGKALEMAGDMLPYHNSYYYPNQVLSKPAAVLIFIYSKLMNIVPEKNTIEGYFIFRTCVALISTGCIPLAYLIGNYLSKRLGLIVAAMVTFFPPYVNYAKQVTGDIGVLFFDMAVMLCSFYYMEKLKNQNIQIVLMTFFAALATLEKWHGGMICVYIACIIILCCGRDLRKLLMQGSLALISWFGWIFLIMPDAIWAVKEVIKAFYSIYVYDGEKQSGGMLQFFTEKFLSHGGFLGILLIILGIWVLCKRFEKKHLCLLVGLLNWSIMSLAMNRIFERWGLEFYFCLLILMGMGAAFLLENKKRMVQLSGGVLLFIVLFTYFSGSVRYAFLAARSSQDTRLIGEKILSERGISEEDCIWEYYTPFAPGGIRKMKEEVYEEIEIEACIVEKEGTVYNTKKDKKYAIISSYSSEDGKGKNLLEQQAPKELVLESKIPDLMQADQGKGSGRLLEFSNLYNLYGEIEQILAGDAMGPTITVYNIENL